MFSIDALENGILKSKENISVLEGAIQTERDTIQEYHTTIEKLQAKARHQKELEDRIEVDRGS